MRTLAPSRPRCEGFPEGRTDLCAGCGSLRASAAEDSARCGIFDHGVGVGRAYLRRVPGLLHALSDTDRPRERLWSLGPTALTATELVAVIVGTGRGGRSALDVAADLLEVSEGSLRRLAQRPRAELLRAEGIGPTKAARLLAGFELGARLAREERPPVSRIREPEDVARLFQVRLRDLQVEEFHLLALDSQSQVLREVLVTRGLLNSSLVHPREVFRAAIAEAAAGIIVVHNHPSGDPSPSVEDRTVTRQLAEAGRLLDLPLYDHVIIAGDRFVSLAALGLL